MKPAPPVTTQSMARGQVTEAEIGPFEAWDSPSVEPLVKVRWRPER